jgi:hypothetical protein
MLRTLVDGSSIYGRFTIDYALGNRALSLNYSNRKIGQGHRFCIVGRQKRIRRSFLHHLGFFILCTSLVYAQDRVTGAGFATRSEVLARNGMVAVSHPLATQIGLDIIKQGGNAIEAAIAANAA